jgi:hypothetical protein
MSIAVNSKEIKALSLDLDGTILAPGVKLTGRTIRAIKACRRRGLKIIINTGRTVDSAEPFRAALNADGLMVFCNGALVVDVPLGRVLRATLLDKQAAAFCAELSRETGTYYQVFFPGEGNETQITVLAERKGPEWEMYLNHTGRRVEIGDLTQALSRPALKGCIKAMFLAEPDILATLREKIHVGLGTSVYTAQTFRTFLEVMDAKVSKGQGLKTVMEHYSLKREEVLAIGDEENDLPMFAVAGFSAAPANAKDSVKAAVDIVIGSNAEDGVAAFLEEFFAL